MLQNKIRDFLRKEKLSGVLVTHTANIRYFSQFVGTNGSLLLAKNRGYLFTDFRYHLEAKKVLPPWIKRVDITKGFEKPWKKLLRKNRVKRLGFEAGSCSHAKFLAFKKMSGKIQWKDISKNLSELRMQKSPEELKNIAKAQEITDRIFASLRQKLKPGMTENQIGFLVEILAREFGAEDISFPPIIGINEHGASPHHHNTDRKLKKGDLILLDFGVIYKGFCSDMTRMLFTKQPTQLEQKIYSIVKDAQETAESKLRSGMKGFEVDALSREIIKKAGYGKWFGHSLGHGVGLEIHELPNLAEKYQGEIPENSVVTVEPGIYLPGKFGVRLEDMVTVGKTKVSLLTKSPKDLQEVTIRL